MNLILNVVHVPSTETKLSFLFDSWWLWKEALPLSSQRRLRSFLTLGDWSPFHNFALDSEISSSHHLINLIFLQTSSIVNNLSVHCFEPFLDRTKPRQSEAEQSPATLTCTILPGSHLKACRLLIIDLDPIERRNLGCGHSANVYWIILTVLVPFYKLLLHGNARGSCKQFCLPRKNRSHFWARCSLTLTLHGSEYACPFSAHAIIALSVS